MKNVHYALNVDVNQPEQSRSTNEDISKVLKISMKKIDRVKKRFVEDSIEVALMGYPKEREYEKKVDGDLESHFANHLSRMQFV